MIDGRPWLGLGLDSASEPARGFFFSLLAGAPLASSPGHRQRDAGSTRTCPGDSEADRLARQCRGGRAARGPGHGAERGRRRRLRLRSGTHGDLSWSRPGPDRVKVGPSHPELPQSLARSARVELRCCFQPAVTAAVLGRPSELEGRQARAPGDTPTRTDSDRPW